MQSSLMKALFTGETKQFLKDQGTIRRQDLGMLLLHTGKIVANDPCCFYEKEPFLRKAAPGEYPVRLFIFEHKTDQRVAFAVVCFTDQIPERFEPALVEGQDAETLGQHEFYGYGVDSGTGGFMDASICDIYDRLIDESGDYSYGPLDAALDQSYVDTYSTANVLLPGAKGNLVAFSSGWGDGCYPSFWGFDEKGEVCCLITDFCIVGDEE